MNQNNQICCQEDSCTESFTKSNSTPFSTAQPVWQAEKDDDGIVVEVELPGVQREGLDLKVDGRELRLNAPRTKDTSERRLLFGQPTPDAYALKLRLGESLDGYQLTAALNDGVLKIRVPLAAEAKPRSITID
jgi:HSP20 family protein